MSKSPPVDEKTLLAPWYVGLNASQDKTALIKELQSTGSVGEFFVRVLMYLPISGFVAGLYTESHILSFLLSVLGSLIFRIE